MNGITRSQRGSSAYGYGYESTYHKSHEKYLQGTGTVGTAGKKSRRAARADRNRTKKD
ncbi:hypothetical protein [Kytococcus aerolatus]|nr:hypothetical protein [Kytococcus aerolatus]